MSSLRRYKLVAFGTVVGLVFAFMAIGGLWALTAGMAWGEFVVKKNYSTFGLVFVTNAFFVTLTAILAYRHGRDSSPRWSPWVPMTQPEAPRNPNESGGDEHDETDGYMEPPQWRGENE